jgi:hypothetical protein
MGTALSVQRRQIISVQLRQRSFATRCVKFGIRKVGLEKSASFDHGGFTDLLPLLSGDTVELALARPDTTASATGTNKGKAPMKERYDFWFQSRYSVYIMLTNCYTFMLNIICQLAGQNTALRFTIGDI